MVTRKTAARRKNSFRKFWRLGIDEYNTAKLREKNPQLDTLDNAGGSYILLPRGEIRVARRRESPEEVGKMFGW